MQVFGRSKCSLKRPDITFFPPGSRPLGSPRRHLTLVAAGHGSIAFLFFFASLPAPLSAGETQSTGLGRGWAELGALNQLLPSAQVMRRARSCLPRQERARRGDPVRPPPTPRKGRSPQKCGCGKFSSGWDPPCPHPTPHTAKFQDLKCFGADWVTHFRQEAQSFADGARKGRGRGWGGSESSFCSILLQVAAPGAHARKVPSCTAPTAVPGRARSAPRKKGDLSGNFCGGSFSASPGGRPSQGGGGSGSPGWTRPGRQPQSYQVVPLPSEAWPEA